MSNIIPKVTTSPLQPPHQTSEFLNVKSQMSKSPPKTCKSQIFSLYLQSKYIMNKWQDEFVSDIY